MTLRQIINRLDPFRRMHRPAIRYWSRAWLVRDVYAILDRES